MRDAEKMLNELGIPERNFALGYLDANGQQRRRLGATERQSWHVWTPSWMQERLWTERRVIGCGHVSGL